MKAFGLVLMYTYVANAYRFASF